ncbi:hypothetical protein BSKO_01540 [Bryopsis sp. KO-2023]|nr:hypothetical protein BSKO_01540 [Bryopsis sp. KO-2023]
MVKRIQIMVVEELKAVTIGCSLTLSATSSSTSNQDCESGIFPVLPIINPAAILGYKLQNFKMQQDVRAALKTGATVTAIVTADADSEILIIFVLRQSSGRFMECLSAIYVELQISPDPFPVRKYGEVPDELISPFFPRKGGADSKSNGSHSSLHAFSGA